MDPEIRRKANRKRQRWGLPWFRNFDGWWYVTIRGQRHKLAKGEENREDALAEWHRLESLSSVDQRKGQNPFWVIAAHFRQRVENECPSSYRHYRKVLNKFCSDHDGITIDEITPAVMKAWLYAQRQWTETTRSNYLAVIVACLNWAAAPEQKYIEKNPLAGMRRPASRSRGAEAVMDEGDFATLLSAASEEVRTALLFLRATGTRPGNLEYITADCIDEERSCVRIDKHKTAKKSRKPLVIPLASEAMAILKRLAGLHPDGPLFVTPTGLPMTGARLSVSVDQIKRRKGLKFVGNPFAYALRHTFATELFGVLADAELSFALGHKDTKMLYHHYGHMETKSRAVAEKINRAVNGNAEPAAKATSEPSDAGRDSASAQGKPSPGLEQSS